MKLSVKAREMAFRELKPHPAIKRSITAAPPKMDRTRIIGELTRRKAILNRARERTRDVLRRKTAAGAVDAEMQRLRKFMWAAPEPTPKVVTVRVIGVREKGKSVRRFPLAGIAVRLMSGKKTVDQARTDWMGMAMLQPGTAEKPAPPSGTKTAASAQKGSAGKQVGPSKAPLKRTTFRAQVQDTDGKVVAEHRVAGSKAYVLELAENQAPAAAFIKGTAWLKAEDGAAAKAKKLKSLVTKAMKRQVSVLEKELQDLDIAMKKNHRRGGEKDGTDITGKK